MTWMTKVTWGIWLTYATRVTWMIWVNWVKTLLGLLA